MLGTEVIISLRGTSRHPADPRGLSRVRSLQRPLTLKIWCITPAWPRRHGVAGVVLSNHGGRQLDFARSGIEVLPEAMAALREEWPDPKDLEDFHVFVDGGVRRGTDIVKALALGATAVLVGRPVLYGLAVDGPRACVETSFL